MIINGRTEAFSDGVFAIAVTLLVLELHDPVSARGLAPGLAEQWPSYAAYAVSFFTIGIIWVNHSVVFAHVRSLDRSMVFLNLGLLMLVSFIPFPTGLLASHIRPGGTDSHVAAAIYGATMTLLGVIFSAIWWRITTTEHLLAETTTPHHARAMLRRSVKGPVIYLAATALSILSAGAALFAYGGVAVYFALPGRSIAPAEGLSGDANAHGSLGPPGT